MAHTRDAQTSSSSDQHRAGKALSTRDQVILVAIALLVVAVFSYLALQDTDAAGTTGGGAELEHVHGLGVDPAGEALYAGTHHGLFRLPEDGEGMRVAGRVQDFMGFTVAGPDHFLASGHPGEGQGGPTSLGLIESIDGGQTWQSLSLAGEADFHALEYRHGRVYGYNSLTGDFMVSNNKRDWETRTSLPMADFAVSPENSEVIVATTDQGLARSEDGGRSFGLLREAPRLLLVSWADDGTLVGVDPSGSVYVRAADGSTWEQPSSLEGTPEALSAVSGKKIFAAAGDVVLASRDGGRSFTVRYQD